MDIVDLVPDSQCNEPCASDATELCGSANRLAVYEDTSATPPTTQQCIVGNIDTPRDFTLQSVPFPNGGTPTPLAAVITDPNTQLLSLTVRPLSYKRLHVYSSDHESDRAGEYRRRNRGIQSIFYAK